MGYRVSDQHTRNLLESACIRIVWGFTSYGNDRQTRDFLKSGPALVTRKQKKYRPIKMAWISESIRSYRGHDHIVQDHLSHNELAMATCRILL